MHPVMAVGQEATVATTRQEAQTPVRLTTTLYDLIAALQAVAGPENDALVVAAVLHLLQSGRLIWLRPHGGQWRDMHGAAAPPGQYLPRC